MLETPQPEDWQVYNVDEVGFDPNGGLEKVYVDSDEGNAREFTITTADKAPFWVTGIYFTRADGQMLIPPGIIHKAAGESTTNASHISNIPKSLSFTLPPVPTWIEKVSLS